MKKLKVFIFEDKDFIQTGKELEEILASLGFECEISFVDSYKIAKEMISKERFDIISLCDLLDATDSNEARRFVATVSVFNPKAITFFLFDEPHSDSFIFARNNEIAFVFSKGKNFGRPEIIFHPDEVIEFKKAMIKKYLL